MGDYWKKLHQLLPAEGEDRERARKLFHDYQHRGYLVMTNRELLELPLRVIIDFFNRSCALHRGSSPVSRKHDARWMVESDICFFNIRGTGLGRGTGDLVRSAILLTNLRTDTVHLAPFTQNAGENVNSLLSHTHINEDLVNRNLLLQGVTAEDQLEGFIQAAHSLKIKVGMDLPLALSTEAEALVRRPDLFRWIKLNPVSPYILEQGHSFVNEIGKESQIHLGERIKSLVEEKKKTGLPYAEIRSILKEEGYYPIPVNSERARGIPFFVTYDESEGTAQFTNSSQESKLTTFLFTHPLNEKERVENISGEDYFSRIFPLWQKKYNPDFIYFDSLAPSYEEDIPYNETPTPGQISHFIQNAREQKRYTGVMTSGTPDQLEILAQAGFNIILDRTSPVRQDRFYMEQLLNCESQLREFNKERKHSVSLLFPLGQLEQNSHTALQRVRRNHFLSRFLGCGPSRRGKYEAMGFNDGSSGFIPSLVKKRNLEWSESREHLLSYHYLEDIYSKERAFLDRGKIIHIHLDDRVFWWVIKSGKGLIVPLISVENNDMLPPNRIDIDLDPFLSTHRAPSIMEYDFESPTGNLILFMGGSLPLERIPYRSFRLFTIK
jgi:hypothetical protein